MVINLPRNVESTLKGYPPREFILKELKSTRIKIKDRPETQPGLPTHPEFKACLDFFLGVINQLLSSVSTQLMQEFCLVKFSCRAIEVCNFPAFEAGKFTRQDLHLGMCESNRTESAVIRFDSTTKCLFRKRTI